MTLIKSISGIRGTIGGKPGDNLSPIDIVKFTSAFGKLIQQDHKDKTCTILVGRDARISGAMVSDLITATLSGLGINTLNLGYSTTPTVEMAVTETKAQGGIIITASHNPGQWNALKLLNHKGEFINDKEGKEVLTIAENEDFEYAAVDKLGKIETSDAMDDMHIEKILALPLVDIKAIQASDFKIAIDCVNSVGGIIIPKLLKKLGVKNVIELYCTPNGIFPHNPEPLPENLTEISSCVKKEKADVGFVVDPDVDRLAIINEDGSMFGEEYTLVAVADYILANKKGNTVSNLSSTRALKDVTEKHGGKYQASAVGEVNVVTRMKDTDAVIGGEGNGGIIYPELHYGRDALVGIALFLTHLAKSGKKCSELRKTYPEYHMSKNKIELQAGIDVDKILEKIKDKFKSFPINDSDGVRIDFEEQKEWVHMRKSNTEPIIRVYTESGTASSAKSLAERMLAEIKSMI